MAAGCAGRRADPPPGLAFPRAERLPGLRVERLLADGPAAVRLGRVDGEYRLERLGAVVDLPFTAALILEGPDGERLRILVDHHPDEQLPLGRGMRLHVRYARHGTTEGRHEVLALRDGDGGLRFLLVVRPPAALPFQDEAVLPAGLRPEPTDERVYREFSRQESYCTTERDHFAIRLPDGARWRRVAPGERVAVSAGEGSWRLHLVDLSRVATTDCAERPPDRLSYQVYAGSE